MSETKNTDFHNEAQAEAYKNGLDLPSFPNSITNIIIDRRTNS